MAGGVNAEVYCSAPKGEYVLELKLGEKIETLVVCASGPGTERIPHVLHIASKVREVLGLKSDSGLLDMFSNDALPRIDEHDALYGLAKLMEYVRDPLVDSSLSRLGKLEIDGEMRVKLLTVDDLLKSYRADGKGLVIGHQADLARQYHSGPVSDAERASLERVCLDAKK